MRGAECQPRQPAHTCCITLNQVVVIVAVKGDVSDKT
jgi:hypothetical protein